MVGGDNGRQKTRNRQIYDVIVGGNYLLITPITLANLSPKPKTPTGAGRYQLLSRCWDAYRKQLGERLLEKSGRCGIAAD